MQHNFILYQPSLTHPLFECIPSDTLLYTNNLELPGTNSAMSLESLDRSSNHKATPTRIKKDVDPFNSSLLAAMDPGLSPWSFPDYRLVTQRRRRPTAASKGSSQLRPQAWPPTSTSSTWTTRRTAQLNWHGDICWYCPSNTQLLIHIPHNCYRLHMLVCLNYRVCHI